MILSVVLSLILGAIGIVLWIDLRRRPINPGFSKTRRSMIAAIYARKSTDPTTSAP